MCGSRGLVARGFAPDDKVPVAKLAGILVGVLTFMLCSVLLSNDINRYGPGYVCRRSFNPLVLVFTWPYQIYHLVRKILEPWLGELDTDRRSIISTESVVPIRPNAANPGLGITFVEMETEMETFNSAPAMEAGEASNFP
jgi:hypothetical protein